MEVRVIHSLNVALIEPADLDDGLLDRCADGIDIVRMVDPPCSHWSALREAGYVRRPARLVWPGELGDGEEAVLARMGKERRRKLARARRQVTEAGIEQVTHAPLTQELFDAFLVLYEAQINQMRRGMPYAVRMQDELRASLDDFYAVFAYRDGLLVGGCLCEQDPTVGVVRLRFSAVDLAYRRLSLGKVIYFTAMQVARESGYRQVTLGTDRNLYGLSAEPGLFQFKASLGFTAVPSQDFHEPYGIDFADLVLSLDSLADPSFALGYADDESRQLHGIVYSKSADVDLTPFDASFLTGVSLHTIPPRH